MEPVKRVQGKILEIMKYIDRLCRANGIPYYIMGGTALGAVRHGGFIPWDDDLDIFMTPAAYARFKTVFEAQNSADFVLQEWRTVPEYLEYAKVRMNGTAFIEEAFRTRRDLHQGIYVDIMILHKVPKNRFLQKLTYFDSKYVTLLGLSQRGWRPKTRGQAFLLNLLKILPKKAIARRAYRRIYRYDDRETDFCYCYWITPAKFRSGLFDPAFFGTPRDIPFEDTVLLAPEQIEKYLAYRYGDYLKLPPPEAQKAAVHAAIYDTERDYTAYLANEEEKHE